MSNYDIILVGAGLFSGVLAEQAARRGKKALVVERRSHIGGNIYTEERDGIHVHRYGAHIFHTDSRAVWDYVNALAEFNRYTNSPVANYGGQLYNLPFNMNTFNRIWPDVVTPADARARIAEQAAAMAGRTPRNLEEQAVSLVGRDIYERLIKGYTEKQWGRPCTELPPDIIRRLPVRLTYDNNYFNDRYQGIPVGGYTQIARKLFAGAEVRLGEDFLARREEYEALAPLVVYTGMIDEYFGYELGALEYRSLRFETERLDADNWQGVAVMNYTGADVPYTRIIEHKHFDDSWRGTAGEGVTYITREYPADWHRGDEPYYPVNDGRNAALYRRYAERAAARNAGAAARVVFGGRLGQYRYYDMDDTIAAALEMAREVL